LSDGRLVGTGPPRQRWKEKFNEEKSDTRPVGILTQSKIKEKKKKNKREEIGAYTMQV
jgi:hypothetical protein